MAVSLSLAITPAMASHLSQEQLSIMLVDARFRLSRNDRPGVGPVLQERIAVIEAALDAREEAF